MILSPRFEAALQYACVTHAGQTRKATPIPYISHLLAVTALVLEYGGDEDAAIGALLHDAAEDAGGEPRLCDIRARFGEVVAQIVKGCTDTTENPKPPWRQRKEKYIAHLESATPPTLLVSCCDKLHNARSIVADATNVGEALWGRFNGGKGGTVWYYEELVACFDRLDVPKSLVDELRRTVKTVRDLADGNQPD